MMQTDVFSSSERSGENRKKQQILAQASPEDSVIKQDQNYVNSLMSGPKSPTARMTKLNAKSFAPLEGNLESKTRQTVMPKSGNLFTGTL